MVRQSPVNRSAFARAHPDLFLVDPADAEGLTRYLVDHGVLAPDERPIQVSRAGEGNMNCTVRVITPRRRLIVKQGRPWVEKYDHIPAPWGRTLVEAAFYETVARAADVAGRMPALIHVDKTARIIALGDVDASDYTAIYTGSTIEWNILQALVEYLVELHGVGIDRGEAVLFANRDMRALNHEHIFRFPLAPSNGLDLDRLTPGLQAAADALKRDDGFGSKATELGERYLADGSQLVHGDFFPGSWLRTTRGPVIIDPEFCFLGAGEFDFGVMIAHLTLAGQSAAIVNRVIDAIPSAYDLGLTRQFAGVEIMRRLIGVAQLPLNAPLERKQAWLDGARELVVSC